MADVQSVGASAFLILVVVVAVVVLLGPRIAPALEELSHVSLPAAPAASTAWSISTNWGDIDLDVDGALQHAIERHGEAAEEALRQARHGNCRPYLPCGTTWDQLADGTKGYFSCSLDGQTWLIPFLADGLLHRLVAMTAYPVRASYEPRIYVRGDCAPVELLTAVLGGDYDDDR